MMPNDRSEIERLLSEVARLLRKNNLVHGGEWAYTGTLDDGRLVKHRFAIKGIELKVRPL